MTTTKTNFKPPNTFWIRTPWLTLTPWRIAAKYKKINPVNLVLKSDGSKPNACIKYSPNTNTLDMVNPNITE